MGKQLEANTQIDLGPGIQKYFPFPKIRAALNDVNEALDEDTQRGTDRLIRNVIQDITEVCSLREAKHMKRECLPHLSLCLTLATCRLALS
jgi:hypothetical protein